MGIQLIQSNYAAGDLTRLCDAAIQRADEQLNQIAHIPLLERNVRNTLLAFEKVNADFSDAVAPLTFMGYVSTQPEVSQEGSECEQKVSQYMVSIFTRKDLYLILKDQKDLNRLEAKLLRETLNDFEDNGLKLSDERLKQMRELKQILAQVESKFSTHLNHDQSTVEFKATELEGVPQSFIDGLKKTHDNQYTVTTKEPDYIRVMENASCSETRRRMLEAFENKSARENTQLLEEAIIIRQKIAAVMGYKNWADYQMHTRMAKDSDTVLKFLHGLKEKLSLRSKSDLANLLKIKQATEPTATEINPWDIRYFSNQLKKRDLNLDDEQIREYFPADTVVSGLFEIYSKLLSVKFIEEKNAEVWAPGVQLFQIRNSQGDDLIGYFYMDFIPRPGKYGHAAAFSLISGRMLSDGTYSHPISAIVANFSSPEKGKPSLLKHEEVTTLFHEFGHIMHQTLTKSPFASLSGSNVDQDFVEAPSQMLENWAFSSEVLGALSGHYQDHSCKLPEPLLKKIIEARDFNQGYFYTRQLLLALLDMTYHTQSGPVDTIQIYQKLYKELLGIDSLETGHFPASFGHLMGGYDAGYYGYLWSEVYAEDMFTRFQKEGLLNSDVGQHYRKFVLEQGKMMDAFDILRQFLGREPNTDAFYKRLHIEASECR